jgi:galactose mutarotase-like enzyme
VRLALPKKSLRAAKIMANFMSFPAQREYVLSSGDTTIGIIPDNNLVSHFQVASWQVLYRPVETGNVMRWGLPLMIPNFSRLKDGIFKEKLTRLPPHGFGRLLPWTVIEQNKTSISLQLMSSDATRADYPYEFTFTTTVAVGDGTLTYTLRMENRSDELMPIAPGFHPYFAVKQADKTKLTTDGPLGFAVASFNWDTQPPNNPYPFPHHVSIQFPHQGTLTIAELPIADRYSLSTMQVWSEPVTTVDHEFVCFEPVVTSEDGLNRPQDRLNIAPQSSHELVLQLSAQPVM